MNRIEIEVLSPRQALTAFSKAWRTSAKGKTATSRLAFGSLRELFSAITEKRLELLRYIAAHEGLNTRQLSRELGRDYKNIHTDVTVLTDLGLLEKNSKGALSAPFDEIVIHAGIRSDAA